MTTTSDKRIQSAVNALNKISVEDCSDGTVMLSIITLRNSLRDLLKLRKDKEPLQAQQSVQEEPDQFSQMTSEELDYIRNNQLIYAIKAVRERTGMGLLEAKHLVECAAVRLKAETAAYRPR